MDDTYNQIEDFSFSMVTPAFGSTRVLGVGLGNSLVGTPLASPDQWNKSL